MLLWWWYALTFVILNRNNAKVILRILYFKFEVRFFFSEKAILKKKDIFLSNKMYYGTEFWNSFKTSFNQPFIVLDMNLSNYSLLPNFGVFQFFPFIF